MLGYVVAGVLLIAAAASGEPIMLVELGWREALAQTQHDATYIAQVWAAAMTGLFCASCLYLVGDRIRRRAFDWRRVSRLFFWFSFLFFLLMQLLGAASGV